MIKITKCSGDSWVDQENLILEFEQILTISPKIKNTKNRCDKFDQQIVSSTKKHAISFRDQIDPQKGLVDINVVDNWKTYNIVREKEVEPECVCQIF